MAFPVVVLDQVIKVHANKLTQCVEAIRFEKLRLPAGDVGSIAQSRLSIFASPLR